VFNDVVKDGENEGILRQMLAGRGQIFFKPALGQDEQFRETLLSLPTHLDRMSVPLATGAPISSNEVKIDPKYEEEHAADFVRLPISHKFYLSNLTIDNSNQRFFSQILSLQFN
jgi:hypothetical protein